MIEKWSVLLRNYQHFHGTSMETDSLRIPGSHSLRSGSLGIAVHSMPAACAARIDLSKRSGKGKRWDDGTMGMMISVENNMASPAFPTSGSLAFGSPPTKIG